MSRDSAVEEGLIGAAWHDVGGPVRGAADSPLRGAFRIVDGPLEDHEALPASAPPSVHRPRRGILTRFGFVWGFPIVLLFLATHLWATGWRFGSGLMSAPARSCLILQDCLLIATLLGGILTVSRSRVGERAHPQLLPALQTAPRTIRAVGMTRLRARECRCTRP